VLALRFGAQLIPFTQAAVAAAEPGQCDQIDLLILAHGGNEVRQLLIDSIVAAILQHAQVAVISRIGTVVRYSRYVLDVELARLEDHKADFLLRDRQGGNRFCHCCAPRLG
jgi:hypothetical protein